MAFKFRYQLKERLEDGTLWEQDLKEAAEGPCPDYPQQWQRDSEARMAVLAAVYSKRARWAIDPDNGNFIFGCYDGKSFNAVKLHEALKYGTLKQDPFK